MVRTLLRGSATWRGRGPTTRWLLAVGIVATRAVATCFCPAGPPHPLKRAFCPWDAAQLPRRLPVPVLQAVPRPVSRAATELVR